jgi:GH24 family phage-related lysozyme (muramidase)
MQYLGFYGFTYNAGTNSIESSTSYDYIETYSYEYVYFDVLTTLQCVDCKQVVKLIENAL